MHLLLCSADPEPVPAAAAQPCWRKAAPRRAHLQLEHRGRAAGRATALHSSPGCRVSGLPSNTRLEGRQSNPAPMKPASAQPPGLRSRLRGFSLVNTPLRLSMNFPRCQNFCEGIWPFLKKNKIYEKSVCLWKLRSLHAHLTCSLCQCHSHQKITPGKQRSGRSLGAPGSAG